MSDVDRALHGTRTVAIAGGCHLVQRSSATVPSGAAGEAAARNSTQAMPTMTAPSLPRFPLTLLHLTDLHFGDPAGKGHYWNTESPDLQLAIHNQRGLLKSMIRDLRTQKLEPDLVFVTGDLLDKADPRGIPLAINFLAELTDQIELPRTRVVLIPGNHDVSRDPDLTKKYAAFGDIWTGFYGSLLPSFNPATPAHLRVERFDYTSDLGVEVVGFNSCEELDDSTNQEHGSVKTGQRDRAEDLLMASEGKNLFRIALMHHHLERPEGSIRHDYSVMDDAAAMIEWLASHRFQLALHGHQHVDWDSIRIVDGWTIAIVAGASAGVANYGRVEWNLPLGYQVIVLDEATSGRRIRREYNPQRREWTAAGRGAAEKMLRFGPELTRAGFVKGPESADGGGDISIERAKSRTGGLRAHAAGPGNVTLKHIDVERDIIASTGVRDPKA
ncbi:metallophosphoesterase family protein [Sorangium sp. So ce1153]|uniref:metallophosphoesterase family protein n=1 Tax=Sorangium sp. So ce1153 TaxID=3133333 RepID=UPI003F5FBBCD